MCLLCLIMIRTTPTSTLFPYTTLFRSNRRNQYGGERQNQRVRRTDGVHAVGNDLAGEVSESHTYGRADEAEQDRKSTRLNSSHLGISYAVFCLKKKNKPKKNQHKKEKY